MAKFISCPTCARRLSVENDLPAEQPVKCPACAGVFPLPPGEKPAAVEELADDLPWPRESTDVTAADPRRTPPRAHASETYDDAPSRTAAWDDEDDDWLKIRRPARKRNRTLMLTLSGAGALLLIIAALLFFTGESSDALIGSWKGTFQFGFMNNVDCTYRFRKDGIMIDEHIDPITGMMERARGRYTFENGMVNIRWGNGGFEKARVRRTGPHTIEYVIVDHSDVVQIGGTATFSRDRR